MRDIYTPPSELRLGTLLNNRVPEADQQRQRAEVDEILRRLRHQPGVILADEVGMGKTFVALAVAYSIAIRSPHGPVIVMVPANLVDKWEQDLQAFCELYLENRRPVRKDKATPKELRVDSVVRYGVARHSVELMRLLDDPPRERCHLIFLAQGAMSRQQTDKWVRLALIAEALRRHGRGKASRLIQVKRVIHRFLAELLWAIGEERAHDLGEELWQRLLSTDPRFWKTIFNDKLQNYGRPLSDDPIPKSVSRALVKIELKQLAEALKKMPVKARGGKKRVSERLDNVRKTLREHEKQLWKELLASTRWRSSMLVLDEAHHLKNPGTALAKQLQSPDSNEDLRTGDGAMAKAFDRMLFLTATPFQLGHRELIHVLERFGDVRWDEGELGSPDSFKKRLEDLGLCLDESQRAAITLQRCWSHLRPEDCSSEIDDWWKELLTQPASSLQHSKGAVVIAFDAAKKGRDAAEKALRPWVLCHNKGALWEGTGIPRRQREEGAAIAGQNGAAGIAIPQQQLLPFFLAARSAVKPGQDLLGEALCSSYEAFRLTRQNRRTEKDDQDVPEQDKADLSHANWYLEEFDRALERHSGAIHPKVDATVRKVIHLWERGEKVLVFAFYRYTCRALRIHISREMERHIISSAKHRLRQAGQVVADGEVTRLLDRVQNRFFDAANSPGRLALDQALNQIILAHSISLDRANISPEQRAQMMYVMRHFLRVSSTLALCFPLAELNSLSPSEAIARMIDYRDVSGLSWRSKFESFIEFLTEQCSTDERSLYLEAVAKKETGVGTQLEDEDEEETDLDTSARTLPNVKMATGGTRRALRSRLMRAFNTPFFPDVLVCSEVMGEGVDLQRFCRHVIHHDLDWNPSSIEQRTGRIDRLGCKAEYRQPIVVFLPFLAGAADERQFRVMSDREKWFRVVMGQDEVARLITADSPTAIQLPKAVSDELGYKLGLESHEYGDRPTIDPLC